METIEAKILQSVLKNFPHIDASKYTSMPDLCKDIETLRACHVFFRALAGDDAVLLAMVDRMMYRWRSDMQVRLDELMQIRRQRTLEFE